MQKIFIIISLVFCGLNSTAQHGFQGSSHTYSVQNNDLTIYQWVAFSFGAGSSCPPLVWHQTNSIGGVLTVDVLYDLKGAYSAFFCSRIDTMFNVYNGNFDTLIVNAHAIVSSTPDTLLVDQDTSYNSIVSLRRERIYGNKIEIYPLPVREVLRIHMNEPVALRQITLWNLQGQVVKEFDADLRELNVADLPSGIYFLRMISSLGQVQKKVLIE